MRRNATDPIDQQKWDAILQRDESQDGRLFFGVRTTGVYCRPSCRSKLPLRKNVVFFNSAEDAEEKGFRPCKRCKPDLSEHDRANPLPDQLKKICDLYFDDRSRLSIELERLDIHQNRLIRLFHQKYHTTPTKYLNGLRLTKAAHQLIETDQSMLQIASQCGFGSVSGFYSSFKFKYGQTPIEYRKNYLRDR